jgi:hypothetical protein
MQGDADLHYHIDNKYVTYYQYADEMQLLNN